MLRNILYVMYLQLLFPRLVSLIEACLSHSVLKGEQSLSLITMASSASVLILRKSAVGAITGVTVSHFYFT